MAYVTYPTVHDINTPQIVDHIHITDNCMICQKTLLTPNSLRLHTYYHQQRKFKCDDCNQSFVYQSKLKQHRHWHITQRLYCCFHGGCSQKYKHPQDLNRHVATHQQNQHECDFCDKVFRKKGC